MALRSHILAGLVFGDYGTGEMTLAQEIWRELPEGAHADGTAAAISLLAEEIAAGSLVSLIVCS